MDADLRKPRCHRHLGAENRDGLADVLSGAMRLDSALQPTQIDNLDFLASGDIPGNPSELLGSIAMIEALQDLRRGYDYIIIDSPPVIALVVDCAATSKQKVRAACARLHHARARLLGIVLNKAIGDYEYYQHYQSDDIINASLASRNSTQDGAAQDEQAG
jgi:capsular exopolysaccharide synthesis family protein